MIKTGKRCPSDVVKNSLKALAMLSGVLTLAACITPGPLNTLTPADELQAPIDPAATAADLDQWLSWTGATHPDLGYSVDQQRLEARASAVRRDLSGAETRQMAWSAMAQLNPLFADAHIGLRLPETSFQAFLSRGGRAFPAPVEVQGGRILVANEISGESKLRAGDEILSINGFDTSELVAWMMLRLRGEDDSIRERILSLRFPLALWTYAGHSEVYEVTVIRADGKTQDIVLDSAIDKASGAASSFALQFVGQDAIMQVDTFEKATETAFQAFLETAFQDIAQKGTERLIIDLRQNGGGAHELSDRLMNYLTTQPYSPTSEVLARITPENQSRVPGSQLGSVLRLPFKQTVTPPSELVNRFEGEAVLWIGPDTYSQAIVFAATAQDHGVARLVGTPTSGRANQTGQTQRHRLNVSGFDVQSPIYVFTRSSGERSPSPLQPDLMFEGHDTEDLIEQLSGLPK